MVAEKWASVGLQTGYFERLSKGMLKGSLVKLRANDKLNVVTISITRNLLCIEVGIDGDRAACSSTFQVGKLGLERAAVRRGEGRA